MYVAVIILKQEQLLKRIASLLIECGLFDSTVIDGEGVENVAAQSNALFRELRGLFGPELVYNRTIIVHLPDKAMLEDFVSLCRRENIDFTQPGVGVLMAYPCEVYIGPGGAL